MLLFAILWLQETLVLFDRTISFEVFSVTWAFVGEHTLIFLRVYIFATKSLKIRWLLDQTTKWKIFYRNEKSESEKLILKRELLSNKLVTAFIIIPSWGTVYSTILGGYFITAYNWFKMNGICGTKLISYLNNFPEINKTIVEGPLKLYEKVAEIESFLNKTDVDCHKPLKNVPFSTWRPYDDQVSPNFEVNV